MLSSAPTDPSPPDRPSVFLWGPPGSGKTTLGALVAERLGRPFIDVDQRIEAETGRSIAEIFTGEGEAWFRELERKIVRDCLAGSPSVVALGGGALVDSTLREEVLGRGLVVRLVAPLVVLASRVGAPASRPLLAQGPDPAAGLKRLLDERASAYRAGHLGVDATRPAQEAADLVASRISAGVVPLYVPPRAYGVWLASGSAGRALGDVLAGAAPSSVHVIADATVNDLFGADLLDAMPIRPRSVHLVGPGESAKTFAVLERVSGELLEAGVDRDSIVIGLGGGATTDLAGLAASLLARGVRWIAVPTTLLSMVDAAVGGKTAINLGSIKNPVGAFHQPAAVVVDPSLTGSEPERGYRAAMAELVKTALIGDPALFEEIEASPGPLLAREPAALLDAVSRAVRVKARIVVQDPDEQGIRALLNLGHTVGHAIEAASAGALAHGEAVAMGLEAAMAIGVGLDVTPDDLQTRVVATLRALGLPALGPIGEQVLRRVQFDKKRRGSAVQLVLLRRLGCAEVVPVPLEALQANLRKLGPLGGLP